MNVTKIKLLALCCAVPLYALPARLSAQEYYGPGDEPVVLDTFVVDGDDDDYDGGQEYQNQQAVAAINAELAQENGAALSLAAAAGLGSGARIPSVPIPPATLGPGCIGAALDSLTISQFLGPGWVGASFTVQPSPLATNGLYIQLLLYSAKFSNGIVAGATYTEYAPVVMGQMHFPDGSASTSVGDALGVKAPQFGFNPPAGVTVTQVTVTAIGSYLPGGTLPTTVGGVQGASPVYPGSVTDSSGTFNSRWYVGKGQDYTLSNQGAAYGQAVRTVTITPTANFTDGNVMATTNSYGSGCGH